MMSRALMLSATRWNFSFNVPHSHITAPIIHNLLPFFHLHLLAAHAIIVVVVVTHALPFSQDK